MSAFMVKVRTVDSCIKYDAIGTSSAAVHQAALDLFGGLCSVVVMPLKSAMAMEQDDCCAIGLVRTRAIARDPFAGLRGRDYIVVRGLDAPMRRITALSASVDMPAVPGCLLRATEGV